MLGTCSTKADWSTSHSKKCTTLLSQLAFKNKEPHYRWAAVCASVFVDETMHSCIVLSLSTDHKLFLYKITTQLDYRKLKALANCFLVIFLIRTMLQHHQLFLSYVILIRRLCVIFFKIRMRICISFKISCRLYFHKVYGEMWYEV